VLLLWCGVVAIRAITTLLSFAVLPFSGPEIRRTAIVARGVRDDQMKTRSIVYSKSHRRGIRGISVYAKGSYTRWYRVFLLSRQITGAHEWLPDAELAEFKRHPAMPRLRQMLTQYGSDWLRQQGERVVCVSSDGVKTLRLDDWVSSAEAEIARRMNKVPSPQSPTSVASQSSASVAQVVGVRERDGRPDEPEQR
jgi:hypothetical protein